MEDLNRAIDVVEQALAATPAGHPDRATILTTLGDARRDRYERFGEMDDLDRVIEVRELAVAATPAGHTRRAGYLSHLGGDLLARFKDTGTLEDLDRAIEVGEQALASTPAGHPGRANSLSILGVAYLDRYGRSAAVNDLERAIEMGEQAVAATPADDSDRAGNLSNLGIALRARYQNSGEAEDLDRAIEVGEQAVATSTTGYRGRARAGYLANLANALHFRYRRSGALEDLDRAIELIEQASAAAPQGDPSWGGYLQDLGAMLLMRHERSGVVEDLDRAIQLGEQALAAIPAGYANRPGYLSNLGMALQTRYDRTHTVGDLDRAIEVVEQAVAATPEGSPDRAGRLSNLGIALRARYENSGEVEDLNRAIEVSEQAVTATPQSNPTRAALLFNVGIALETRYELIGTSEDLDRRVTVFREASTVVSAPVDVRARAARNWGQAAALAGRWREAVDGFGTAVELMGLVGSRGLGRADQEFRLSQLSGVGSEAAAVCVQAGQPDRAVELFEQGRAVLFSQVLDTRTDLSDLQGAHPELAADFVRWRDELDRPGTGDAGVLAGDVDPVMAAAMEADRRRDAAAQFERILAEIRTRPGFDRFLAPRPVQELLPATAEGPVVLVNLAILRSDALILTAEGVDVLPLYGVDPNGVIGQVNLFLDALAATHDPAASAATRAAAEASLSSVLGWVGEQITSPILGHLGYTTTPSEADVWPRVWWCPSGPLSALPLHAAGHHELSGAARDAVIDRVISSTIPTVGALLRARKTPPLTSEDTRVLVVAMPHTVDQPDLPGTAQEADKLRHLFPGRVDVLGLPGTPPATHDTVTAALPNHPWVHFACHGQSSLDDPSASHLLLADHQERPLTVVELTRTRLEDVELAFLSACTTARPGTALPDEPIHLAAACQLAGYRNVIATLWPISDADTAWLTERFYTTLTATNRTAANAATALHHATRHLRAINRPRPSNWAPYAHTGN